MKKLLLMSAFVATTLLSNAQSPIIIDTNTDGEIVVPVRNKTQKAYLLTDKTRVLSTKCGMEGLSVNLSGKAPDNINSVVLEVEQVLE